MTSVQLPAAAVGAGAVAASKRAPNGTMVEKREFIAPPAAPVRGCLLVSVECFLDS